MADQSEFGFASDNLGIAPKRAEGEETCQPSCYADRLPLPVWLREPVDSRKKVKTKNL